MGRKFITYNGVIVGNGGLTLLSTETDTPTPPSFTNTKSILLDGVDDFVSVGTTSLGITTAISVSAWVKIPTTNTGGPSPNIQEFICEDKTGGSNRNWGLFWRHLSVSNKYFQFSIFHTNGSATAIQSTGIVPNDNQWHHVMGTFDGTTDANGLKLYVDGTLFQTTAGSTGIRSTSSVEPSIGSLTNGTSWFFEGNIDEVAVWNSDQSTNISTIYNGSVPNDISSLSPLSWWRCGDGDTAPTLTDNGSGGNNGTMTNFSTFSTDVPTMPFSTKSIVLDGVDDRVDCGNDSSLQITGALTLSAWIKTTDNSVYEIIIGKDSVSSGTRSYMLYKVGSKARFLIFNGPSSFETVTSNINVTDGNWHHIMGVNDGTDLKIYVNGTLDGTNVGGGGTVYNGTSPFYIGMRAASPANRGYFTGTIDEVAVWNTDQSANASAIGGTRPTDLTSYNPISWWRCGDGDTAPTLTDNGSASNDGTMQNFSTFSTDVPLN